MSSAFTSETAAPPYPTGPLPSQSVADIAFTYGFASQAHFVATFKQHMGITPGAFRNAVESR